MTVRYTKRDPVGNEIVALVDIHDGWSQLSGKPKMRYWTWIAHVTGIDFKAIFMSSNTTYHFQTIQEASQDSRNVLQSLGF